MPATQRRGPGDARRRRPRPQHDRRPEVGLEQNKGDGHRGEDHPSATSRPVGATRAPTLVEDTRGRAQTDLGELRRRTVSGRVRIHERDRDREPDGGEHHHQPSRERPEIQGATSRSPWCPRRVTPTASAIPMTVLRR